MQEEKRMMKNKSKLVLALILVGVFFSVAARTLSLYFTSHLTV
jgi:flagellar basal body-associated protein FliL